MHPELTAPTPCALNNFRNADSNSLRFMGSYHYSLCMFGSEHCVTNCDYAMFC